ncbi:MAG: hypothetical protein EAY81_03680 [Bacteroidetes bacterium]|nr:MAG: hypothetical protein EAY81_03680 [Bacteroidota bacterium]
MKTVRFLIITVLLVCVVSTSYSQFADYKPLRSTGAVPEDFLPDKAQYTGLTDEVKSKKDKKLFDQYAQSNEYAIANQLNGGYVLYGTEVNKYINAVADKLLESNPVLRAKLRFYVVQHSLVNAYTYGNGAIMVNTGLIAHLKNEAQLAFILSHEIAHYLKEHSFDRYTLTRKIDKKSRENRDYWEDEGLLAYTSYSKEKETEADLEGFKLYYQSQYALNEAQGVFDMLSYGKHPFDSLPVKKQFFEGAYLKIPAKYFSNEIFKEIDVSSDENENDTFDTHPALYKRKQLIGEEVSLVSKQPDRKVFLVSESEFNKIRDICRFELSRLFLIENSYINSIYNTYLLLSKYPDNQYLYSCLIKSIYFLQLYTNNTHKLSVVKNAKKIEGEIAKIHFLFKNFNKEELNTWSLRMAWDIHSKYRENDEIWLFTQQITKEFQKTVSKKTTFFAPLNEYNDSLISSFYVVTEKDVISDQQKKNRGKKISKLKFTSKGNFCKYAMPDYLNNDEFTTSFKQLAASIPDDTEEDETEEKETKKERKKRKKKAYGNSDAEEPINRVLLVDLVNIKVDNRKEVSEQYKAMKASNNQLAEHVKKCAELNGITVETLLPFNISSNDTSLMPDRGLLRMFLNERLQHNSDGEYYSSDYKTLQEISKKYNTEYIAFMYNVAIIEKKNVGEALVFLLITAAYFPPSIFASIYNLFEPEKSSHLGLVVYNLKSGKLHFTSSRYYKMHLKRDFAKSEFYNLFYRLKKKQSNSNSTYLTL